jgi:hypothetical protein
MRRWLSTFKWGEAGGIFGRRPIIRAFSEGSEEDPRIAQSPVGLALWLSTLLDSGNKTKLSFYIFLKPFWQGAAVAQSVLCLTTGWTTGGRSPTGAEDFSSSLCVQTGSGAHPASCTVGTGGPFPGGKTRPGREADHSPPSSAEVKNELEQNLLSPQAPPWRVAGSLYLFLLFDKFSVLYS